MAGPAPPVGPLDDYAALLQRELGLLHDLLVLSNVQRQSAATRDADALAQATATRDQVMERLAQCEAVAVELRRTLKSGVAEVRALPRFRDVLQLHGEMASLLTTLAESDCLARTAVDMLNDASRADAQALEAGGATLAAYRRVIAPPLSSAELVDQRG